LQFFIVPSSAQIAVDTIPHANCGFGHGLKGAPNPNPVYDTSLPLISTGLYLYTLQDSKGEKYTGKLTIE